jgi:hypothetical protein
MTVPVGDRYPYVDSVAVGDEVVYRPADYPIADEYRVRITAASQERGGVVRAITHEPV